MPYTNSPRQPLLGPWPPFEWRQDVEEKNRFPAISLRHELLDALRAIHHGSDEGRYPAAPPREIVALLNDIGPPLDERAMPMVEAILNDMWGRGQIGRVPAPSPRHAERYLSREAAEVAIADGAPVLLRPMADGKDDLKE